MFRYDNMIFNAINKAVYMGYASVLWVLFSLPIFTIGASSTALYYCVNKVIKNETGKLFAEFWSSFKLNFKQATLVWLLLAAVVIIGALDCWVLSAYLEDGMIFKVFIGIVVCFMVSAVIVSIYIFPYIARFENTTKRFLMNSIYLAVTNIVKSVGFLLLLAVFVFAVVVLPMLLAICPGLYMYCINQWIEPIFRKYMTPEDQEAERKRNEVCNDL